MISGDSAALEKILTEIKQNINDIYAIAIVSQEGLPIASLLPEDMDDIKIAAITAAMLSLGEKAASELKKGFMEELIVSGENGYIITVAAGKNAVLTVSIPTSVKLGLLFHYLKPAAEKIGKLLSG